MFVDSINIICIHNIYHGKRNVSYNIHGNGITFSIDDFIRVIFLIFLNFRWKALLNVVLRIYIIISIKRQRSLVDIFRNPCFLFFFWKILQIYIDDLVNVCLRHPCTLSNANSQLIVLIVDRLFLTKLLWRNDCGCNLKNTKMVRQSFFSNFF